MTTLTWNPIQKLQRMALTLYSIAMTLIKAILISSLAIAEAKITKQFTIYISLNIN